MMTRGTARSALRACIVSLGVMAAAGCSTSATSPTSPSPMVSLDSVFAKIEKDFNIPESPQKLTDTSDLVSIGRAKASKPGPVLDPGTVNESKSVVVEFVVESAIKGPLAEGDSAYIIMWDALDTSPAALEAVTAGLAQKGRMVIYGVDYAQFLAENEFQNEGAGRPADALLFHVNTPLGLQQLVDDGARCVFEECRIRADSPRAVPTAREFTSVLGGEPSA